MKARARLRPFVASERTPNTNANDLRIELNHYFNNVLPARLSTFGRSILNGGPLTCISCGARTQPDGSLPCGH
ncbi:hypothetical protein EJD96_00135 (plasmid) [Herbaspirillum seropedicae]|uniref:hypothetical protein n=1 Tax=Herbaspirillum seropedicae TaxID=964 RepID=UPI00111D5358|nr:hypothetical protein [Herbaspirillum seropedicae]QDD62662.1 hypothetical protein EJD96_00135 [Herbaspirillum seropedicae]